MALVVANVTLGSERGSARGTAYNREVVKLLRKSVMFIRKQQQQQDIPNYVRKHWRR